MNGPSCCQFFVLPLIKGKANHGIVFLNCRLEGTASEIADI